MLEGKNFITTSLNISPVIEVDNRFQSCKESCVKGPYSNDCIGFTAFQENGKTFCQLKAGNVSCEDSTNTTIFVRGDVQNQCRGNFGRILEEN